MVAQRAPATTGLVEASAPDWGQRLGLRLPKTFQSLYPQQPTRLWDAGPVSSLPPAADWPGSVAAAGGVVWLSNGTTWVPVGPQTDVALGNHSGAQYVPGAAFSPLISQAGAYFLMAAAGSVFTVPVPTGAIPGATFFVQGGAGGCTVNPPAGGNLFHPILGNIATYALGAGKSLALVFDGGAAWMMSGTGV